ncbi:MAG: pyruvate oxidoreductase subunit gamma [Nitrospiraceae bacterium]|nr:pyruvate oxidoreductase subunit gamma [Nitrospiraceae bacterium]
MSVDIGSLKGIVEIRWHGRGGQGAISSAQLLARAAFDDGFQGVTSAPTFGAERRGAPVSASNRLSREPLRTFSQIEHPSAVIVLDDTLLEVADATKGLIEDGWLVINSPLDPAAVECSGSFRIATADATRIAQELDLVVAGSVIVNTAMLGAFARATELVTLESVERAIAEKFPAELARRNFEAARRTYERTKLATGGS